MVAFDRLGIAARLRALISGQDRDVAATAKRLGLDELSLRISIDEDSPHPTVEVLAAVIREYGVDPRWLVTGTYDPSTHRSAMEGDAGTVRWLRDLIVRRQTRISDPTVETFRPREN